ncbi:sugar ABC transporter substrate-binding protein [Halomonas binhaiensis]|uniref:Sugar ABC transporter substrate-binding protein n=1 Tax=Halomonas binhaiensis TaxID=2562282 RepID=A0A5C1NLA9_9GAMM|nr:sugar ABC transporter substrate-binding protein [Halomonas binhaiensis]QEM83491.1 sugar ABC transporter substrate-binding protein [Halomonas binhaiensis]
MKLTSILAAGAIALTASSHALAQQDDQLNFIAVTHITAGDPFGNVLKRGFEDAAEELGVSLRYNSPAQYDTSQMLRMIEQAIATQPDGLAVTIPDASAFAKPIRKAIESGIPVVVLNTGEDISHELGALNYVGQSEYRAGKLAGERMREAGVEHPICINFAPGQSQLDARCQGFTDAFEGAAEQLSTTQDPTAITNAVMAHLNSNPDTDGVLSLGSLATVPLITEFQKQGAMGKIAFATFDLAPETLEAVRDGEMLFAMDQQQYLQGYLPVQILAQYNRYGVVPTTDIQTGPNFITQDNAEQVIELTKQGYR